MKSKATRKPDSDQPVDTKAPPPDETPVEVSAPVVSKPQKPNSHGSRTIYVNTSTRKGVVNWQQEKIAYDCYEVDGDSTGNMARRNEAFEQALSVKYPKGLTKRRGGGYRYDLAGNI